MSWFSGEVLSRLLRVLVGQGRQAQNVNWVDFALADNEGEVLALLNPLSRSERGRLISDLCQFLAVGQEELELGLLRILIERARPFVLPKNTWSRPLTSSSNLDSEIQRHLTSLAIDPTDERVNLAKALYFKFAAQRGSPRVDQAALVRQQYRCGHCGLAFFNEELLHLGFVSPFGNRSRVKVDTLKPHWSDPMKRRPTIDHQWPVSLYGDNRPSNLMVLCGGCNNGKANYMLLEQMSFYTGLQSRKALETPSALHTGLFYAQLRRFPSCERTGVTAATAELTVELRNPNLAHVFDNLRTISTPD